MAVVEAVSAVVAVRKEEEEAWVAEGKMEEDYLC